jgi:iron complex transport system substrate-binding protein
MPCGGVGSLFTRADSSEVAGPMEASALEQVSTRRQVLAAGIAVGAALLTGCGSNGRDAAGSNRKDTAAWTFIDDRKHTVRLSERPTRLAAYQTVAAALYHWGMTPVGVFGSDPPGDPWLADFPWAQSDLVGSVYGEIDTAKLLALKTELIVSRWYPPPDNSPLFGFHDLAGQQSIGRKVPIVGLSGRTIIPVQIVRFGEFVHALGVPTGSDRIVRAHEAFDRAAERLSRVGRRRSNLRIIAVSGDQDTMYVAKLASSCDMLFYSHLGVPLISARTSDPYWDGLSWEDAGKYQADGILYDTRSFTLPLADAKRIPGFAALPAVRANQIGAWRTEAPPWYQIYADAMDEMAVTIANWRRVL